MAKQPELILEEQLVQQLTELGYGLVHLRNESDLLLNLKAQLEKHNEITFTDKEFERVLNILNKGSVFEKAKTLREKQHIVRDNGDNLYFEFINTEHWCQNQYQVTHQVTMEGIDNTDDIPQEFEKYWDIEQDKAFILLVEEESLSKERTQALIEHFLYSEKEPMRDEILDLLEGDRPTLLQRKVIGERILNKIVSFVDTFVNGVVGR